MTNLKVWHSAPFSPDNCQWDEVHQKGHNGHVWSPVGVIWPPCPALHLTIGERPFSEYEECGDRKQEREAPGYPDEDFGLLLCLEKRERCLGTWEHTWGSTQGPLLGTDF